MTRIFTYAVAATIALTSGIHAATAANNKPEVRCSSHQPAKVELACGHRALRSNQSSARWIRHHRVLAMVALHHKTAHSLRYFVWQEKVAQRWINQAHARLTPRLLAYAPAGFPPHHALWMCLHGIEGAWNDNGADGHGGGLQMHTDWGYGMVGDAGSYSQLQQEWAAERGYQASHYSSSFIYGQWLKWEHGMGDKCIHLE